MMPVSLKRIILFCNTAAKTSTEKYRELVNIICSADMGWQKQSSRRKYNCPSGVASFVGVIFGKILFNKVMVRFCSLCDELVELKKNWKAKLRNIIIFLVLLA